MRYEVPNPSSSALSILTGKGPFLLGSPPSGHVIGHSAATPSHSFRHSAMLDLRGLEQHQDLLESVSFAQFPILVNPKPNDLGDLTDRTRVIRQDVFRFIREGALTPFDIVYLAPPQYRGLWAETLRALASHQEILKPEGLIIAQMHPKEYQELRLETLGLQERRIYGSTLLCFYSLKEPRQEPS